MGVSKNRGTSVSTKNVASRKHETKLAMDAIGWIRVKFVINKNTSGGPFAVNTKNNQIKDSSFQVVLDF